MNQKIKILVVSIIIGLVDVFWVLSTPKALVGATFGVAALGKIFVGVILAPIFLFILGVLFSKENRAKNGLSWLWISFVVILIMNLVAGRLF